MAELRMVRLMTAGNAVEARIIAARLGAEGIVWQLQGSVDGPLAVGPVEVLVDQDGFESAKELLLADDVESAFEDGGTAEPSAGVTGRDIVWVTVIVVLLLLFAVARMTAVV